MTTIDLSYPAYTEVFPQSKPVRKLTDHTAHYEELCARLKTIGSKAGTGSNGFKLRKQEILASQADITRILRVMSASKYIRPLLALWNETPTHTLRFPVPFDGQLVTHIDKLAVQSRRGRLGRLALFELCNLFFRFYDNLDCTEEISECLKVNLKRYQPTEKIMGLDNVRQDMIGLISPRGHEFLANTALYRNQNLPDVAKQYNIPLRDSRFYEKALMTHYLTRLNRLAPNENAEILHEIAQPEVYDIRLNRRFLVGHQIITKLMDKLIDAGQEPSELWRNVLLRIGGDPRLPPMTRSYSKWWDPIDRLRPERRYPQAMRSWLSKADLDLFLKIMADFAKSQGDSNLQRMYPERERFLRGLFKKGLIRETRLFLGRQVLKYLEASGAEEHAKMCVKIKDGGRSALFYLNLGSAHLIEGSDNCKMRIMDRLPQKSCLSSFQMEVYNRELRAGLKDQYIREFLDDKGYKEFTHRSVWQTLAVSYLKGMGVQIFSPDVMDSQAFYGGN